MKFFHLSDLHIGIRLHNRDLQEDQEYIFRQIADLAATEQPDAVVIAGDIYDRAVPSAEAVEVFDRFLMQLRAAVPDAQIMMISGNHDSAPRINCYRGVLSEQRVHMIGLPPKTAEDHIARITMEDEFGKVNFWLLPFVKPSMVKAIVGTDADGSSLSYDETLRRLIGRERIGENASEAPSIRNEGQDCMRTFFAGSRDAGERNVLVSHQFYLPSGTNAESVERMDSETCTVGNIDSICADVLAPFDYAALGHIHKPMKVGNERYRYCGTPLSYSVSEAGQEKGVLLVTLQEKGSVQIRTLPLHPLRRVRVITGTLQEVLRQASADYVSVTLTDRVDLDVMDMQDRLRIAFPNLLEVRRESERSADYSKSFAPQREPDPYELCRDFLGGEIGEEEEVLLRDVIRTVQERG